MNPSQFVARRQTALLRAFRHFPGMERLLRSIGGTIPTSSLKTIPLPIGSSDDKLSRDVWFSFPVSVDTAVSELALQTHFACFVPGAVASGKTFVRNPPSGRG